MAVRLLKAKNYRLKASLLSSMGRCRTQNVNRANFQAIDFMRLIPYLLCR
jgi:hypothetical protein